MQTNDIKWKFFDRDETRKMPQGPQKRINGKAAGCKSGLGWKLDEPQPIDLIKAMFREYDIGLAVEDGMATVVVIKFFGENHEL